MSFVSRTFDEKISKPIFTDCSIIKPAKRRNHHDKVSGVNNCQFLIDTGATHSIIDSKFAKELNLEGVSTNFYTAVDGSRGEIKRYELLLNFGRTGIWSDKHCFAMKNLFSNQGVHAIIGCDILQDMKFILDGQKNMIKLGCDY